MTDSSERESWMVTNYAFEMESGEAASTAQSRTKEYGEDGTQLLSQFTSKNPFTKQALLGLRKGDA